MAEAIYKTMVLLGRCKCCLNEGELENLWTPHIHKGETEVYGEMLMECFNIPWEPKENFEYLEMICKSCINRLRDALAFRKEVLVSEEVLLEHLDKSVKKEEIQDDEKETEYLDIEVAEVENNAINEETNLTNEDEPQDCNEQIKEKPKRKWPKQLPKEDRNKTYKQYTVKQLKMAMNAVINNEMSCSLAAEKFGVPRKTLSSKLSSGMNKEEENDDATKLMEQEKHYKLVEEIKTILTYTNVIPFKAKASRYCCAYCSTDVKYYEDPDELRIHTRTSHVNERMSGIDHMMKPQWMNEVLKVDIDSLHCTVCCTVIVTWNDMFRHLENEHQVTLDEAYSRVIPYILSNRDLRCALCNQHFPNYHNVDGHMNKHYTSYICYECGDTFLALSRFNKHMEVHNRGRYPCDICGKVFKLKKYLRKHIELVHYQTQNIKCLYCLERFCSTSQRQQHMIEKHNEKVRINTCEICGKTFYIQPYYSAHMRRVHGNVKNHKCKYCGKMFLMKYELRNHKVKHKAELKYRSSEIVETI